MKGRVLAVLWNPGEKDISAGGFRRAYEILSRWRVEDGQLLVLDAHPSFMRGVKQDFLTLYEYRVPRFIKALERRFFSLERLLEWGYAVAAIFGGAVKLRRHYDIVYVAYSEIAVTFLSGWLIKLFLRKRVVMCNLNCDEKLLSRRLNNIAHNRADLVITISRDLRRLLRRQGLTRRIAINYVGLDTKELTKIPSQTKKYDALFIGRHVQEKGIFAYVALLEQLVKKYPHFRFASIGSCAPAVRAELDRLLRQKNLTDHWQFLGIISEQKKYEAIKQSRSVWFLSLKEGWGIVPQEALACGVLPLCYDLPVYRESIRDCSAVFFAPVNNLKVAATQAEKILTLPAARYQQLAQNGQKFVAQFDWERVAQREIKLIKGEAK